ncbi:putative metallopeptidase [Stenotrophomonas africana]
MRPAPPAHLLTVDFESPWARFVPSEEVWAWVSEQILSEDGPLANPDHYHLQDADIGVLWAETAFTKQGRAVIGQAEQVMFMAGGWKRGRMERQMVDWFGRVPSFVITLAADYCSQCSDAEFCALIEHELYHIAQAKDSFGAPKFGKDGLPALEMRGHDVEEFVGVVRRYGPSAQVQQMVKAASSAPEVAVADVAHACGTCLQRAS